MLQSVSNCPETCGTIFKFDAKNPQLFLSYLMQTLIITGPRFAKRCLLSIYFGSLYAIKCGVPIFRVRKPRVIYESVCLAIHVRSRYLNFIHKLMGTKSRKENRSFCLCYQF